MSQKSRQFDELIFTNYISYFMSQSKNNIHILRFSVNSIVIMDEAGVYVPTSNIAMFCPTQSKKSREHHCLVQEYHYVVKKNNNKLITLHKQMEKKYF